MEPDTALIEAVRAYVAGQIDLEALEDVAARNAADLAVMAESAAGYKLFMAVEHAIALLDDGEITEGELVEELRDQLKRAADVVVADVVLGDRERESIAVSSAGSLADPKVNWLSRGDGKIRVSGGILGAGEAVRPGTFTRGQPTYA